MLRISVCGSLTQSQHNFQLFLLVHYVQAVKQLLEKEVVDDMQIIQPLDNVASSCFPSSKKFCKVRAFSEDSNHNCVCSTVGGYFNVISKLL